MGSSYDLPNHKPSEQPVIGDNFFMFQYFSDEYDPRVRLDHATESRTGRHLEHDFKSTYAIKVGDVCYALIGQIVNRNMVPVRYQPTAGLVVNSPVETPELINRVKSDWTDLTPKEHMVSLVTDALASDQPWGYGPALQRLRFYYPNEYDRQKQGSLRKIIREYESNEQRSSRQ